LRLCFPPSERQVIEQYISADLIVSRGGDNLTEDYGYPRNIINALELALWLGKKTVVLGDSIGPFADQDTFQNMADILKKITKIYVREKISYDYLTREMNIPIERVYLFPDMAFFLNRNQQTQADKIKKEIKYSLSEKYAVLFPSSLIYRFVNFGKSPEEKALLVTDFHTMLCRHLSEDMGYKVILIPHVFKDNKSDRLEVRKIKEAFKDNNNVIQLENDYHFWDYRQFIKESCDFVISGRMHPCVSSLSAGKPAINLVYSHKSEGIIGGMFECEELLVDIREAGSKEQLFKECKRALSVVLTNYDFYRHKIQNIYTALYARKSNLIDSLINLVK